VRPLTIIKGSHDTKLEFVFELKADLSPAIDLGPTPAGFRRIIGIVSGTFKGPLLQGVVLPGGADWQIIRSDEVTELHAHYILSTDDAVLFQVNVRGLRHARGDALARIEAGEIVDPGETSASRRSSKLLKVDIPGSISRYSLVQGRECREPFA
jgi:hypothetical protein